MHTLRTSIPCIEAGTSTHAGKRDRRGGRGMRDRFNYLRVRDRGALEVPKSGRSKSSVHSSFLVGHRARLPARGEEGARVGGGSVEADVASFGGDVDRQWPALTALREGAAPFDCPGDLLRAGPASQINSRAPLITPSLLGSDGQLVLIEWPSPPPNQSSWGTRSVAGPVHVARGSDRAAGRLRGPRAAGSVTDAVEGVPVR